MARPDDVQSRWEPGHYFSPLSDTRELSGEPERSRTWPAEAKEMAGIDWSPGAQVALVLERLSAQTFAGFAELRDLQPGRVVEVGSGFSSLVMAQANRERLGGNVEVTCVEPHPAEFLVRGVTGISRLIEARVQEAPLEMWDYPEGWVLEGRAWNEQYLVRSFLTFNDSFEILLGMAWLCRTHPDLLTRAIAGFDPGRHSGCSLWLRRVR